MKIKKFSEKENITEGFSIDNISEEFHENDRNTLIKLGLSIRKYIPSFDVNINGNVGIIKIDGTPRFTTQGHETMATILAYVTGMHTGLTYKK